MNDYRAHLSTTLITIHHAHGYMHDISCIESLYVNLRFTLCVRMRRVHVTKRSENGGQPHTRTGR